MKPAACLLALSTLVALPAFAQTTASSTAPAPHFAPALPPPGLNDPGVNPSASPASVRSANAASQSTPAEITPTHLPGKSIPLPGGDHDSTPDVQVHQEGENTVQEYRQDGRVYMVVITPKNGLAQTYMVDHDGHLTDPTGAPPVKPVSYKLISWGQSKPASASSSGDDSQ